MKKGEVEVRNRNIKLIYYPKDNDFVLHKYSCGAIVFNKEEIDIVGELINHIKHSIKNKKYVYTEDLFCKCPFCKKQIFHDKPKNIHYCNHFYRSYKTFSKNQIIKYCYIFSN